MGPSLFLRLIGLSALNSMSLNGTDVEKVFAVPAQSMPRWLVDSFQVMSQRVHIGAQQPAKVTAAFLGKQDGQVAAAAAASCRCGNPGYRGPFGLGTGGNRHCNLFGRNGFWWCNNNWQRWHPRLELQMGNSNWWHCQRI